MERLAKHVVGREEALFTEAVNAASKTLRADLTGKRVLVCGGAGSIGSQTVVHLAQYPLECLHIVDLSENYLADLMRQVRSLQPIVQARNVRSTVIDYGSPIMDAFLRSERRFDLVLNFAAHKHVRAERDPFSLLGMLETNIVKLAFLKSSIANHGATDRFFSISTDKAAHPASMMGATKRIMEDVCFGYKAHEAHSCATSTRFANVAFSNGSILQAFLHRMACGQPLALPRDTRRYFVTPRESGQLCVLAACVAGDNLVFFPTLDRHRDLITLEACASRFLQWHELEPHWVEEESEAIALASSPPAGRYPVLLTPLDTGGEKPYEEFAAAGERPRPSGLPSIEALPSRQLGDVVAVVERLRAVVDHVADVSPTWLRDQIREIIDGYVIDFEHADSEHNLDQRL